MSIHVTCPDCQRKLKVPETAVGKTIRCPACKVRIPPVSESRSAVSDLENDEPATRSPSRAVKTTPSPQTPFAPSRGPASPELDIESAEKPLREKSSRRDRSIRKKSSIGLIIALAAVGGVLLLLLFGAGGGLLWYFVRASRDKADAGKAIADTEWQIFMPPDCACSVLMPGTPQSQPMTTMGVKINKSLFQKLYAACFGRCPLKRKR